MGLEQDIDLLAEVATLRLLGRDALRILAISAQPHEVKGGDVLYREGEPAEAGFVVAQGAIVVQRRRGGEERESVVARRGALLGETALIVDTVWPGTATALENTQLLRIPRTVFMRTLEGEREGADKLRRHLAARLGDAMGEIESLRSRFEGPEKDGDESESVGEAEPEKDQDEPAR